MIAKVVFSLAKFISKTSAKTAGDSDTMSIICVVTLNVAKASGTVLACHVPVV
jgi:hypothetical protein